MNSTNTISSILETTPCNPPTILKSKILTPKSEQRDHVEEFFGKEPPADDATIANLFNEWQMNNQTAHQSNPIHTPHDSCYKKNLEIFYGEPYPSQIFNYAPLAQYFTQARLKNSPINRFSYESNITPEQYEASRPKSFKPAHNFKPPYARDTGKFQALKQENDELTKLIQQHEEKKTNASRRELTRSIIREPTESTNFDPSSSKYKNVSKGNYMDAHSEAMKNKNRNRTTRIAGGN